MSCSIKISCGKSWSGSQRKINSLTEEGTCPSSGGTANAFGPSTSNSSVSASSSSSASSSGPTTPVTTTSNTPGTGNTVVTGGTQRIVSAPRPIKSIPTRKGEDVAKLLKYIDDNVIGKNGTFFGPFGRRKVVYCDYTASGRSLQFLEEYIAKEVLPCLGDTRASTSICSLQSSLFRHEARDIVKHAVGANEQDALLFTGQGTAGALRALLRQLDLPESTVVFVGPFEHRANLRPWREYGLRIVRVSETREGFLDLNDLERGLAKMRAEGVAQIIGCFTAASCVTGVLADDVATTLLLHQYGALSVWDYTTAAPYVQIDMNPRLPGVEETAVRKDAIIFSGHKFVGGVQSPGVLVAKRSLLRRDLSPEDIRDSHRYHRDPELREESGTSGVVESIRCGLAVQLKENITPRAIVARQDKISRQVLAHVRTIPELILLGSGSQSVKRLPIFSFMVRHPRGTFLHHNFVCAVLNDVFGIQARSGCACAARYAHDLMGIERELAKEYERILLEGESNGDAEGLRPGFAKLSFPYFMSEAEVAFVLEALKMVATEGWKLLPQYVLNPDTGEWRHHTNSVFKERKWLGSIRYTDGKMNASERRVSGSGVFPQSYGDCLQTARNIFNRARKMAQRYPMQIDRTSLNFASERTEALRWFMLPSEAQDLLLGNSQNVKQDVPFNPHHAWNQRSSIGSNSHDNSVSWQDGLQFASNGIRRLHSDIPRTGNPSMPVGSPRHRSLPVLGNGAGKTSHLSIDSNDDEPRGLRATSRSGQRSPATCPSSPMPVRFALGEPVGPSSSTFGPTTRGRSTVGVIAKMNAIGRDSNGRARCNSLGSGVGMNDEDDKNRRGNGANFSSSSSSSPIPPVPPSPRTPNAFGPNALSKYHRQLQHCSCSSQTDLNALEMETSSPSHSIVSSSLDCNDRLTNVSTVTTAGRSSPVSSEDDLRAYVKEVTKELATEIKSEIREVISKVDDALSESNTCESTPQHQSRGHVLAMANIGQSSSLDDKQNSGGRHDSFTASDIAEYLMEFSKEMASEVKSEIRCMVNAVDGLHRHSPDASASDVSSNGCGSPDRGRTTVGLPSSPSTSTIVSRVSKRQATESPSRKNATDAKIGELSQQESKMSSECSSDETVIYVMKPSDGSIRPRSKSVDDEDDDGHEDEEVEVEEVEHDVDDDEGHERGSLDIGDARKILPKIYSAVNSVSSQDSGINLSFHESDKSIDSVDLKRSSSAESNSTSGYARKPSTTNVAGKSSTLSKQRLPKSKENPLEMEEKREDVRNEAGDVKVGNESVRMQWHCPPKNVWKPTVEAMQEFDMIRDNDKVLVCLSVDGKGASLSLLHTLHQYRFYARSKGIDFEIAAATVATNKETPGRDPFGIVDCLKALEVPYFYEERSLAENNTRDSASADRSNVATGACSFCDKNVRARLYALAKRHGYNVLALGQHLDDLTEGFLVSVFHAGKLKTMKAHYYIRRQDLRVVRPFVYVREKALRQFVQNKKFVVSRDQRTNFQPQKQTSRSKELMLQQERAYPRLYLSVRAALRPLITAHEQTSDFDPRLGESAGTSENVEEAISTGESMKGESTLNGNNNHQQRRHRRVKTNASPSSFASSSFSSSSSASSSSSSSSSCSPMPLTIPTVRSTSREFFNDNDEETDEEPVL